MYIENRLFTLYVRRYPQHAILRPTGRIRWAEVFRTGPCDLVLHVGKVEALLSF
jgi:hypothetical protein